MRLLLNDHALGIKRAKGSLHRWPIQGTLTSIFCISRRELVATEPQPYICSKVEANSQPLEARTSIESDPPRAQYTIPGITLASR